MTFEHLVHAASRVATRSPGQVTSAGHILLLLLAFAAALAATDATCQPATSGAAQVSIGVNPVNGLPSAPQSGKPNGEPVIPTGGKFVIFSSSANNLAANTHTTQSSSTRNIYKFDTTSTELISANKDNKAPEMVRVGGILNDLTVGCIEPAVSDVASDGSYAVAFTSDANDLVDDYNPPGTSPIGPTQVYLRIYRGSDKPPKTFLMSEAFNGPIGADPDDIYGADQASDQPTVVRFPSTDGTPSHRFTVCFRSRATNFMDGEFPSEDWATIYCRLGVGYKGNNNGGNGNNGFDDGERIAIANTTATAPPSGTSPVGHGLPQLSRDGSTLTFTSDLSLIAGKPNSYSPLRKQVYSQSMSSGGFTLVSFRQDGSPADGDSDNPSISDDGRYIGFKHTPFTSAGSHVLKGFSPYAPRFFVRYDAATNSYLQINTTAAGTPSDRSVESGYLDGSGLYATFSDPGTNLIGNTTNTVTHVYFKELLPHANAVGGTLIPVSVSTAAALGNSHSGRVYAAGLHRQVALAPFRDGDTVRFATAFSSFAPNLSSFGSPTSAPFMFRSIVSGSFSGVIPPQSTPPPTATPTSPSVDESPISEQPRLLIPNAPITEPPAVEVLPSGSRKRFNIRIVCQLFTVDARYLSKSELGALATAKARIKYSVEIRKAGSRRRITQVSSRNVVTVRKLEPGRYTVRYRVSAEVKKKTIRSSVSPPASIELS